MKKIFTPIILSYLRALAKVQILKFRPIIIGVGGASGKTSLANFISLILQEKYKVLETKGKNSQTGIPLSILSIRIKYEEYIFFYWLKVIFTALYKVIFDWNKFDFFVAELGIDGPYEPKNMSYLLKIVRPKIGVLTNISFEHSQYFEEVLGRGKNVPKKILEMTKNQESLLLKTLPKNGLAVINIDDSRIRNIKGIKADILTVSSKDKTSDFFIEKTESSISNFKTSFSYKNNKYSITIKNPLPLHYATSFLLAIAVCSRFEVDVDEAIKILKKKFSLPPGRLSVFEGIKKTTIIDSSYNNATLSPIMDILDLVKNISGKRRKFAVLGDMRELGTISQNYHKKVAEKILETLDFTILIGPMMQKYAAPVLEKAKFSFYCFENFSSAKKTILNSVQSRDVILVKGSQNTLFLERAVEMLLKDKKDESKLCRRELYWNKRRRETL